MGKIRPVPWNPLEWSSTVGTRIEGASYLFRLVKFDLGFNPFFVSPTKWRTPRRNRPTFRCPSTKITHQRHRWAPSSDCWVMSLLSLLVCTGSFGLLVLLVIVFWSLFFCPCSNVLNLLSLLFCLPSFVLLFFFFVPVLLSLFFCTCSFVLFLFSFFSFPGSFFLVLLSLFFYPCPFILVLLSLFFCPCTCSFILVDFSSSYQTDQKYRLSLDAHEAAIRRDVRLQRVTSCWLSRAFVKRGSYWISW